jgi:hypothetical protein
MTFKYLGTLNRSWWTYQTDEPLECTFKADSAPFGRIAWVIQ